MTGIIILAAGSSSRLGKPKQNLIYQNKTLLQRAIDNAFASEAEITLVVLGANADVILPTIQNLPVTIIQNTDWEEGMASSIRLGIAELQSNNPDLDSVILMLCDQPFVDSALLNQLIDNKDKKGIVACCYDGTTGAPVLFNSIYFYELSQIQGQEGAKKLLMKFPDNIVEINFPLGGVDVDTIEDFKRL